MKSEESSQVNELGYVVKRVCDQLGIFTLLPLQLSNP